MQVRAVKLDIYQVSIPMRQFEHAAATRCISEGIIVRLELSDGSIGWGEAHPRKYVTGETLETSVDKVEKLFRMLVESETLDASILPAEPADILSARCALQIAVEDALAKSKGDCLAGSMPSNIQVSGVVGSSNPDKTAKQIRLMRLFGLRDFKLKIGFEEQTDLQNLQVAQKMLGKAIQKGKCSLRVDVNGKWGFDETPGRIDELRSFNICAVEQPVFCTVDEFIELSRKCTLPLIADESLIVVEDAEKIAASSNGKIWLNVRISKNGGLDLAGKIIELAIKTNIPYIIGCMVGETSILSAAQRVLISRYPAARFIEGNYGKFLLKDDIACKSIRMGWRGRLKPLKGTGLGIEIDNSKLNRFARVIKTIRL